MFIRDRRGETQSSRCKLSSGYLLRSRTEKNTDANTGSQQELSSSSRTISVHWGLCNSFKMDSDPQSMDYRSRKSSPKNSKSFPEFFFFMVPLASDSWFYFISLASGSCHHPALVALAQTMLTQTWKPLSSHEQIMAACRRAWLSPVLSWLLFNPSDSISTPSCCTSCYPKNRQFSPWEELRDQPLRK